MIIQSDAAFLENFHTTLEEVGDGEVAAITFFVSFVGSSALPIFAYIEPDEALCGVFGRGGDFLAVKKSGFKMCFCACSFYGLYG